MSDNMKTATVKEERSELGSIMNSLESLVVRLSDIVSRNKGLVSRIGGPMPFKQLKEFR